MLVLANGIALGEFSLMGYRGQRPAYTRHSRCKKRVTGLPHPKPKQDFANRMQTMKGDVQCMVPAHRGHTVYGPTVYGLATGWSKERVIGPPPPKPKQDPANRMLLIHILPSSSKNIYMHMLICLFCTNL